MAGRPAILKVDIVADAKGVGPGVSEAESKFSRFGGTAAKVGKVAAAGLAVAGAAAVGFAAKSIGAASRTQQAYGALETIYGKNARQVKAWAAAAADSVGLAKSEYSELAALIGSQLQGMGLAQDKSAAKSRELIKVGADLAATYGGTVSDAVSALSSVLKGETDPIERYGVSIKQSDIAARLAAEGLDKLEGKAAKVAKAQVTLSLVNEQTAKTTGAFARESNTLAGQQERLKAKFENLKSTLGEKLLPVATKVVTWVSEKMLPGTLRLGSAIREKLGPAFARVSAFIRDKVIPATRALYGWWVEKIAPQIRSVLVPAMDAARRAVDDVRRSFARNESELRTTTTLLKANAKAVALLTEFLAKGLAVVARTTIPTAFRVMSTVVGRFVDQISMAVAAVRELVGWIQSIHFPEAPGWLSKIPGLGSGLGSAAGLATGAGGHATGAGMGSWASFMRAGTSGFNATTVVVQAPVSLQVSTDGFTDEAALARKLEKLLRENSRRTGRSVALAVGGVLT